MIYKSAGITWSTGGTETPNMAFLKRNGPRGGRNIVERVRVESSLNYTTDGATTMAAADLASSLKKLRVYDQKGPRRYLSGMKIRTKAFEDLRATAPADPASIAISQTNTNRVFQHVVSFKQPIEHDPDDCLMPVDLFLDGGGITIEMPANSDLKATGGTPTIVSGTYTIYVHCREDFDVQLYQRDVVVDEIQKSDTALHVPLNGNMLKSLVLQKDAAGGGLATTTVTDVTLEGLNLIVIPRSQLKEEYLSQGVTRTADDPFYNDKALSVFFRKDGHKWADSPRLGGDTLIRLTSTMATPDVIYHVVFPQDEDLNAVQAVRNGKRPDAGRSVKTVRGTRKNPSAWGQLSAFVRQKIG